MGIQTGLEEFKAGYSDKHDIPISESIRNVNYHMMDGVELDNCKRIIVEEILRHPEGINDKGTAVNTGLPLSSVCARRNELVKMGLVKAVGIGYYPDYKGRLRPNTMWGVVVK